MKVAYLVFGPASSGTRMITKLIVKQGVYGDYGHFQYLDIMETKEKGWEAATGDNEKIVWRRSIPHGDKWPNLRGMIETVKGMDYTPHVVITNRDWNVIALSQMKQRYWFSENYDTAMANIHLAYLFIFQVLTNSTLVSRFTMVSYEAIVLNPGPYVSQLLKELRLPQKEKIRFYNGNAKYYK